MASHCAKDKYQVLSSLHSGPNFYLFSVLYFLQYIGPLPAPQRSLAHTVHLHREEKLISSPFPSPDFNPCPYHQNKFSLYPGWANQALLCCSGWPKESSCLSQVSFIHPPSSSKVLGNSSEFLCLLLSSWLLQVLSTSYKSCRTKEIKLNLLKENKYIWAANSFLCVLLGLFLILTNPWENNLKEGKIDYGLRHHEVWSPSWWIFGGTENPAKKDSVRQTGLSLHSIWELETDRKGRGTRFSQGMPSSVPYLPQMVSYWGSIKSSMQSWGEHLQDWVTSQWLHPLGGDLHLNTVHVMFSQDLK